MLPLHLARHARCIRSLQQADQIVQLPSTRIRLEVGFHLRPQVEVLKGHRCSIETRLGYRHGHRMLIHHDDSLSETLELPEPE